MTKEFSNKPTILATNGCPAADGCWFHRQLIENFIERSGAKDYMDKIDVISIDCGQPVHSTCPLHPTEGPVNTQKITGRRYTNEDLSRQYPSSNRRTND